MSDELNMYLLVFSAKISILIHILLKKSYFL